MELLVLIVPLITALLFWTTKRKDILHAINISGAILLLGATIYTTLEVAIFGKVSYSFLNSFFYIDSLSLIVLDIIIVISFIVAIYSRGYLEEELKSGTIDIERLRVFYSLAYTFILSMVLAVTTQNLGVIWIAVEATTLASALLVGFYNNKKSIEAAWKYITICSVGIAFALLGIALIYYSSASVFHNVSSQLNWTFLYQHANQLQSSFLKIAFIFILVGFGTKVGFVPMHTWLPDAHSQAPSPISALLSGVLLNSALYGIIRVLAIVNKNLGNSLYAGRLLIVIGLLSVAAAAVFILPQKDYKRLLAYSSIEHMGIMAFALGIFTPLSLFAMLFHMINHAFTKSMLFLASGNVYLKYKSKEISKVTGLLKVMPVTGFVFLLGTFAIAGLPPFSIFASELGVIISAFKARHSIEAIAIVFFIAAIFTGIAVAMLKMFLGENHDEETVKGEINIPGVVTFVVLFAVILITGIYMPQQLNYLIKSAANIIMGGA